MFLTGFHKMKLCFSKGVSSLTGFPPPKKTFNKIKIESNLGK